MISARHAVRSVPQIVPSTTVHLDSDRNDKLLSCQISGNNRNAGKSIVTNRFTLEGLPLAFEERHAVPLVGSSESRAEKRRYVTLDGLRGVAALTIVVYHAGHRLGTWSPQFGYLAVDLFFLLSGFVLAFSYEPRFRRGMGTAEFLIARIVRLYPLYFLGLVLGAATALLNADFPGLTLKGVVISFCFGLFGLPSDVVPNHQALFAVNGPFWSLFFEFWVANIIFVLFRKILDWKVLLALVLACGVGLVMTEKLFYTIGVGWGWDNFAAGFVRVGFSFFAGVGIARIHAIRPPKLSLPSWFFIALLPVLLSLPFKGPISHRYELICVFILFPAMVYWGAGAFERRPWLGAALGDASYAMYAVHDPLWVLASWSIYKMALQPSLAKQFVFVLGIAALSWGLNIADTRIRAVLMSRVRTWGFFRGKTVVTNRI